MDISFCFVFLSMVWMSVWQGVGENETEEEGGEGGGRFLKTSADRLIDPCCQCLCLIPSFSSPTFVKDWL